MKLMTILFSSFAFLMTVNVMGYCSNCPTDYYNVYSYDPDVGFYGFYHNNYYDVGPTSYAYNNGGCYGPHCGNYSRPGCCNAYNNGNYNGRCTGNCLDETY